MSNITYQTRLNLLEDSSQKLGEYAFLSTKVKHHLFKDLILKKDRNELKRSYLKAFKITARQYNACLVEVEGKIASIIERTKVRITELSEQINSLKKTINKFKRDKHKLHNKKRKLHSLENKIKQLKSDLKNGKIRLCFGGKRLFHSQFHLHENGYASHQDWKQDWDKQRNSEFFVLGSKEETAGNQTCTAKINEDGSFDLRLRLPDVLQENGKYLIIPNVRFKYGHDVILSSLRSCLERKSSGDKSFGVAISYRFKKDKKGWILFLTTSRAQPEKVTKEGIGAIGVDINANHLAFAETDRFGNIINKGVLPLNTYGKDKNQTLAVIGDVSALLVSLAVETKKPIILEKLDFQKKKMTLKEESSKKQSRLLSSFCYRKILERLQSRAWASGVSCYLVNPAFTSIIGFVKFSNRYGLSTHQAAAFCIARRYLGFSEEPPKAICKISDGKNSQVTLRLPVRNRRKHVWVVWGLVKRKVRVALAAHFQTINSRSSDPPLKNRSVR